MSTLDPNGYEVANSPDGPMVFETDKFTIPEFPIPTPKVHVSMEYVHALELACTALADLARQEWPMNTDHPLANAVWTWGFGDDRKGSVEALRALESGQFAEQNAWRP